MSTFEKGKMYTFLEDKEVYTGYDYNLETLVPRRVVWLKGDTIVVLSEQVTAWTCGQPYERYKVLTGEGDIFWIKLITCEWADIDE